MGDEQDGLAGRARGRARPRCAAARAPCRRASWRRARRTARPSAAAAGRAAGRGRARRAAACRRTVRAAASRRSRAGRPSRAAPGRAPSDSARSLPASSAGSSTLSRIVRHFSRIGAWNTMPMSGIGSRHLAAGDLHRAARRRPQPGNDAQQGGLAAAARADQRDELAAPTASEMSASASTGPLAA